MNNITGAVRAEARIERAVRLIAQKRKFRVSAAGISGDEDFSVRLNQRREDAVSSADMSDIRSVKAPACNTHVGLSVFVVAPDNSFILIVSADEYDFSVRLSGGAVYFSRVRGCIRN